MIFMMLSWLDLSLVYDHHLIGDVHPYEYWGGFDP